MVKRDFFNIGWSILYCLLLCYVLILFVSKDIIMPLYIIYIIWLLFRIFKIYYKRIEFKKKYPYAYNEIKFNLHSVKCKYCGDAITYITTETKVNRIIKNLYEHQHSPYMHRRCVFYNELKLICKLKKRDYL